MDYKVTDDFLIKALCEAMEDEFPEFGKEDDNDEKET